MSSLLGIRLAKNLLLVVVLAIAAALGRAQNAGGPDTPGLNAQSQNPRPQSAQAGGAPDLAPASLNLGQIVTEIQRHAQAQTLRLRQYRALRHYQLDYRSFSARMDAEVSYDAVLGKSFRIVSESGSRLLCDKVLKRALESEIEASRDRGLTALNEANYRFRLLGKESLADRPAYMLDVQPLTASKFLFRGKIWVDAADFAVVKMETEPAKNPSFWIARTLIHYSGAKFGGFWLPRQVRTETKVRIGGTAILTIDYGTYQVVPATLQAAIF